MTGPQFLALIAVIAAGLLASKLTRHGRYHCGTCGDRFDTETGLAGHIDSTHGLCEAPGPSKHTCALPKGHTQPHVHICGCGLPFTEEDQP